MKTTLNVIFAMIIMPAYMGLLFIPPVIASGIGHFLVGGLGLGLGLFFGFYLSVQIWLRVEKWAFPLLCWLEADSTGH